MGGNGWLGGLAAIFTIGAGILAVIEYFAPRCPNCNSKVVIVNNIYYCNKCQIHVTPRTK